MTASTAARPVSPADRPARLIAGRRLRDRVALAVIIALSGIGVALAVRDPLGALEVARNAAVVLVVITMVVGIHEFAHLVTARLLGIGATTFAIGFGKVLVARARWGVEWQIRMLPLGGFVALKGESEDAGPGSFSRAAAWKRIAVLLAGPASNVVLAILMLAGLLMAMRGFGPVEATGYAVGLLGDVIRMTVDAVAAWLPIAASAPLDSPLVGLPGMVVQTGQVLEMGPYMVVVLAVAFSCSTGFLNALPIPPLDGGQALLVVLRSLAGGRTNERLIGRVQVVGLRVLLIFSGGITLLDLVRLLSGRGV